MSDTDTPASPGMRGAFPVLLSSSGATERGQHHDVNEDALSRDDGRRVYVVSDGVGGTRGAGTASATVVRALAGALSGDPPRGPGALQRWLASAFKRAAQELVAAAGRNRAARGMAATATLLYLDVGEYWVGHVGDSRAYRLRAGRLEQLTRDHSVAWEQYEIGALTKDQLRAHPNQRLLTRTFSATRAFVVPEIFVDRLEPGDAFVLCTDGVTKELSDEQVLGVWRAHPLGARAAALVEAAGGEHLDDDATAIAVETVGP